MAENIEAEKISLIVIRPKFKAKLIKRYEEDNKWAHIKK